MTEDIKKYILLVEDESITAMMEQKQLKSYGYSTVHVLNGEDAIKTALAPDAHFDLILMDIDLGSGIDGTDAAALILEEIDIPIVFLSSHIEPEIVEKTEKITSYGYVVKGSGITVLDASIKMAFKLFNANRETREKESLLQSIAENYPNSYISIIEKDYSVGFTSGQEFTKLNLDPDQFVGLTLEQVFREHTETVRGYYERTFNGEECSFELLINEQHQLYKTVPFLSSDGSINQILAVVENVTERKLTEKALQESESLFSQLFEQSIVSTQLLDIEGNTIRVNSTFCKLFGVTVEDMMHYKIFEDDAIKESDAYAPLMDVYNNKIPRRWHNQFNIAHASESSGVKTTRPEIVYLENLSYPILDMKNNLQYFVIQHFDITERKKVEDEIQKQLAEKETLLREVHHRVKNNITNIESFLTLQIDSTNSLEAKEAINGAISRVKSIRILYDNMLLSKDLREVSIKNYIETIIDSLSDIYAEKDYIIIEKQFSDFSISSKQAIMIGIIINELLTNVFKHAFIGRSKGTVSIAIEKTETKVTIIFKDNGIGVDEIVMENKLPGFGLTIVKMLVEQFKGTFSIVNKNGTKSIIQFEI